MRVSRRGKFCCGASLLSFSAYLNAGCGGEVVFESGVPKVVLSSFGTASQKKHNEEVLVAKCCDMDAMVSPDCRGTDMARC